MPRVVHRRAAVSSAAGNAFLYGWRNRARYARIARGRGRLAGRIKKSCTSGLFWTLLSNNIVHRFSAGRH